MKNMKKILTSVIFAVMLIGIVFAAHASAFESYDTYTYSIDLEPLRSPTAYSAFTSYNSLKMGLTQKLSGARDLLTDDQENVYIADAGNNRIVVLNKYYSVIRILDSYVDEFGQKQTFNNPSGLYVTDPSLTADGESYIYVCDTNNCRVVVFDRSYPLRKPTATGLSTGSSPPT